jgi:hypothetical protein
VFSLLTGTLVESISAPLRVPLGFGFRGSDFWGRVSGLGLGLRKGWVVGSGGGWAGGAAAASGKHKAKNLIFFSFGDFTKIYNESQH